MLELLKAMPDTALVLDLEGRCVQSNREECVGRSLLELFPAAVASRLQRALGADLELEYQSGSGFFECRLSPLGRGGLALVRDVTERSRTQILQAEADHRWRALLEFVPDVVLIVDQDHRIAYMNRAEAGVEPHQAVGLPVDVFLPEEFAGAVREQLEHIFRSGETASYETVAHNLQGVARWYSCRGGPVLRDGRVAQVIVIATDITDRKRTEAELSRSRTQLRGLSARLQSAQEEERLRLARELHDELGQLLTALQLDLSWLHKRLPDELLTRAEAMATLLDTTIREVRRISAQLRPPLLDDLGLAAALDWLSQEMCGRGGLSYSLDARIDESRLVPECAVSLFRIGQEALTNVLRHSEADEVRVRLVEEDGALVLEVSDNGRGLSENGERESPAMGLLGIEERAQLWGGQVQIEGAAGKGTTLRVRIPLSQAVREGDHGYRVST